MSEVEATITEALPKNLFRARTDDGKTVVVSIGGVVRQTTVKVIPGDRVVIEVSQRDPTRGRIKAKTS